MRTRDGAWLQHGNQRVPHIQAHLKAIGLGHLLEDERFKAVPSISLENRELLRREVLKKQLEKTADEWMEIYLKDGNIAAEPYRNCVQAMDHPCSAEQRNCSNRRRSSSRSPPFFGSPGGFEGNPRDTQRTGPVCGTT